MEGGHRVHELDLWTGEERPVLTGLSGEFYTSLSRSGCQVYLPRWGAPRRSLKPTYRHPHASEALLWAAPPEALIRRNRPNALVLDQCRYRLEDEALSGPMQVWQAQRSLGGSPGAAGERLCLLFTFQVAEVPETPVYLCVEGAARFRAACNGVGCPKASGGFLDKAMGRIQLRGLQKGSNCLALSCGYTPGLGLENVFLTGDFAVDAKRRLTGEPERLRLEDAALQGYPHYGGSLLYAFPFSVENGHRAGRLVLDYAGALAVVCVNGRTAGYVIERGFLDIRLQPGPNALEIEIVGTGRNLLGPFHQKYQGRPRIGAQDFTAEGAGSTGQ